MIEEMTVQNYALIDQATVTFQPGFNVLTGETGAGKSILIGALGLLLGSKAESEVIRSGADEAVVTGVFQRHQTPELGAWLENSGLNISEDEFLLRRVVRTQKRGSCHLGAFPITRTQMEEFMRFLVDLHGQNEHQSLFSIDQQRRLLDRFAGLETDLKNFAEVFGELSRQKKELEALRLAMGSREIKVAQLSSIISEIKKVNPSIDEVENLKAEKTKMDQHEKLYDAVSSVLFALTDSKSDVLTSLRQAIPFLNLIIEVDSSLGAYGDRYSAAFYELEDLAESLATYRRNLQFSPDRLEAVNERLSTLHGLEKRYGPGIEGVLETLRLSTLQLAELEGAEISLEKFESVVALQEQQVIQQAITLSEKRQEAARLLESQMVESLCELGMPKARFQILVSRKTAASGKPVCSVWGLDQIEFVWAANLGENLAPLRDTASGGELSRLMLALKTRLSDADEIPILIFDEIDTGIGGEIGQALGRYLKRLSERKQVLCITHLASIAAWADHHLRVEKRSEAGRTSTLVQTVLGEERVQEIARMLSGGTSSAGVVHARELIAESRPGGRNVEGQR